MAKAGKRKLIAGLDIGSSAVRMAVGQIMVRDEEGGEPELQILGAAEAPSEGVNKGAISSIEDVVSAISACYEKTERIVGVPIDSVWLGVSGLHIIAQSSKGVVAVSKADNEIGEEDVTRSLEAARAISTPLNYEVLHVLPKVFGVDGQTGIKDPVGMTGVRLEVDAQIILGASAQIKNLTKAVYRSGLEIEDLVLSILATAEAALTPRQKDLGVLVVDLGGCTTSLAVFEEGDIVHTAILPIGSEHITNDIAIGLRTSIDIAERVKIQYGDCWSEPVSKRDEIDLSELGASEHELVKRKYLSEIIEARAEEILFKIDQELRKVQRNGLLPAGVVFTGAGAKLPGLVDLAKKNLRLPATLGYPLNIASVTDKINDLGFVGAVGLVKWGAMMGGRTHTVQDRWQFIGIVKSWINKLLP
ncbi:MAG: cell division protein FtsA [Candidatus Magasanikbacteria bacterium RIFOXYD2_FULL_41_14]|uniref:Cell division protein FtsA n=1 Tax=Candidatus Magasanikbacteria bacterium RIFOXYD2_FULL_41_14 TaxID=1798709 RepID=A0A1F6PCD4_9BACT|nr:MAG: cell division protein FtsA [Candidatus Magasanikbacteria bacterium RIFOXYD2_FULL_41_14]